MSDNTFNFNTGSPDPTTANNFQLQPVYAIPTRTFNFLPRPVIPIIGAPGGANSSLPGVMIGLILNSAGTFSLFPVVSYVFTSKPTAEQVPDDQKEVDHGVSLQLITSLVLSDEAFVQVTPIYDVKDLRDDAKTSSFSKSSRLSISCRADIRSVRSIGGRSGARSTRSG